MNKTQTQLLREIAQNPMLARHFFENLKSLKPMNNLIKEGLFRRAPAKVVSSNGSYRYVPWYATDFLAKVSQGDLSETEIQSIVRAIDSIETLHNNPWAYSDLIKTCKHLPSSASVKYVGEEAAEWIENCVFWKALEEDILDWINRLIKDNFKDKALELSEITIVHGFLKHGEKEGISNRDTYELKRMLDNLIPIALESFPIEYIKFLSTRTYSLIASHFDTDEELLEVERSKTYLWIDEGHLGEESDRNSFVGTIINELALMADKIVSQDPESLTNVLAIIKDAGQGLRTFDRVQLWLLRRHSSKKPKLLQLKSDLEDAIGVRDTPYFASKYGRFRHIPPQIVEELAHQSWPEIISYIKDGEGKELPDDGWNFDEPVPDKQGFYDWLKSHIQEYPEKFISEITIELLSLFSNRELVGVVNSLGGDRLNPDAIPLSFLEPILLWLFKERWQQAGEDEHYQFSQSIIRIINRYVLKQCGAYLKLDTSFVTILKAIAQEHIQTVEKELIDLRDDPAQVVDLAINSAPSKAIDLIFNGWFRTDSPDNLLHKSELIKRPDWEELKELAKNYAQTEYPSIAFVLGDQSNMMMFVDENWTMNNMIEPLLKGNETKVYGAKVGILKQRRVYDCMYPYYVQWCLSLSKLPEDFNFQSSSSWAWERFIVGHVVYVQITSKNEEIGSDSIAEKLFNNAPLSLRKKAVKALKQFFSKDAAPAELEKAKALWSWRLKEGQKSDDYREVLGLFSWLEEGMKNAPDWMLEQLKVLLNSADWSADPNRHWSIGRIINVLLENMEQANPMLLAELLEAWCKAPDQDWIDYEGMEKLVTFIWIKSEESRPVLKRAMNTLTSRGYSDYQTLLSKLQSM